MYTQRNCGMLPKNQNLGVSACNITIIIVAVVEVVVVVEEEIEEGFISPITYFVVFATSIPDLFPFTDVVTATVAFYPSAAEAAARENRLKTNPTATCRRHRQRQCITLSSTTGTLPPARPPTPPLWCTNIEQRRSCLCRAW